MELTNLTISQAHEGLKKKEFSALELANTFFDRIEFIANQVHKANVEEELAKMNKP